MEKQEEKLLNEHYREKYVVFKKTKLFKMWLKRLVDEPQKKGIPCIKTE